MRNCGLIYLVNADCSEHIEDFAKDVIRFRAKVNRDIIAQFANRYIHVKSNMTINEFMFEYNKLIGGNANE